MTTPLFIDFETRSAADLKQVGLHNYVTHPTTDIWCMAYAFGDEPVQLLQLGEPLPQRIIDHVMQNNEIVAHNAQFEIAVWHHVCNIRYGWPAIAINQFTCTMARCYAMNLPGALENAAPALGLRIEKDTIGRTLMMRMCKPSNPKEVHAGRPPKFVEPEDRFTFLGDKVTGEWAVKRLGEYCAQDVEVERQIYDRTVPLSAFERRAWQMDQRINRRGVQFDMEAVHAALAMRDKVREELDRRMAEVTQGAVTACTALQALKEWTADYGVAPDSLAKAELSDLLTDLTLPDPVRTAFELRREAGRATSVAKLDYAARAAGDDGRVRYVYQYHGAGTGRWAGRGIQPHNFTRDLPKPSVVDDVMALIKAGDSDAIDMFYGPPLTMISKLLRAFIVSEPGKKLVAGDYSNVEGRGLVWLAGEDWKLQAFRDADADPDGPDIYEQAYARVFHKPVDKVTSADRQVGKVIELSMGYQGGVGAFQNMAGVYGVKVDDETADAAKVAWREAHPAVVKFWYDTQRAAIAAVKNPDSITVSGAPGRQLKFRKRGSFLWMLLPSGRALCYPYPEIRNGTYGDYLTYKTAPSQEEFRRGQVEHDKTNTRSWARVATYGGKLVENATQAICRDLLANAMLNLEHECMPVVMHVHDEVVVEGEFNEEDRAKMEHLMTKLPAWAEGFPLVTECWLAERYRK